MEDDEGHSRLQREDLLIIAGAAGVDNKASGDKSSLRVVGRDTLSIRRGRLNP
jgi:hypothetical protein